MRLTLTDIVTPLSRCGVALFARLFLCRSSLVKFSRIYRLSPTLEVAFYRVRVTQKLSKSDFLFLFYSGEMHSRLAKCRLYQWIFCGTLREERLKDRRKSFYGW